MRSSRALLLILALAVSGCAAADFDFLSQTGKKPVQSTGDVETIDTGANDPLPPATLLSEDQNEQQAVAALPPPPPVNVNDDPDQFLEKDGLAVNAALGAPGFIRRDGPAEVWQYTGRKNGIDCILDVYLYNDASNAGSLWVKYVELRGATATRIQRRACFADMLRRQIELSAG